MSIGAIINFNDDNDSEELFAARLQSDGFETAIFTDASLAVDKIMNRPNQFSLVLVAAASKIQNFAKQVKSTNSKIKVVLACAFAFNDVEISNSG